MAQPFDYPPRLGDRFLGLLGQVERAGRGTWRRLLELQSPFASGNLNTLTGHRRAPAPGASEPPDGPPLLYLPALPWSYRFQRPQQLASALGDQGHPVLYVDGFLRSRIQPARRLTWRDPGVAVLHLAIPGRPDPFRSLLPDSAVRHLAVTLTDGLRQKPLAIVVQLPFWGSLGIELRRRLSVPLVYDRIDLHTGFPGVPASVGEAEEELISRADLVTATSLDLQARSSGLAREVRLLPNAVALGDHEARSPGPADDGTARSATAPVAGFVGALNFRIDAAALAAAAEMFPQWRFRLAGGVEEEAISELARYPNVELLGEIPYRRVARFLAGLDVGMIPYRDIPLTRSIDPVKLYEMFAAGLPVVARRLPEMERFDRDLVVLYDESAQFSSGLASALHDDTPALAGRRRSAAAQNTWQQRATDLLSWCRRLA